MLFLTVGQKKLTTVTILVAAILTWQQYSRAAEDPTDITSAKIDNKKVVGPLQIAVLSGGCFWGVQGVFEHVKGVRQVTSGYSGV